MYQSPEITSLHSHMWRRENLILKNPTALDKFGKSIP